MNATQWAASIEDELKNNILSFWLNHTTDEVNGGFYGYINRSQQVDKTADKALVLNARIMWTFSAAYRLYRDSRYLETARRAYQFLKDYFTDAEHGGLYWSVSAAGEPVSTKKQVYGQAFVIYAYSEFYRATGDVSILKEVIELYHVLERHAYDPVHQGYIEALTREWKETNHNSLSAKDLNSKKSMNTHLHVLEAYTNLYRIWPAPELRHQLHELITVTLDRIVCQDSWHFKLFFDMEWQRESDHISYGHDIEGSWLLYEAAEVLGEPDLLAKVRSAALQMAEATLKEGVDQDGGLFNEAGPSGLLDTDKDWWPQAEAVVGFYNAFQLTGNETYRDAALKAWTFIERHLVDKKHGEWHWSVRRDGTLSHNEEKAGPWKCPYHNSRACMEMIQRLSTHAEFHNNKTLEVE
ncbi:N-acylglucosamine 2-epimerase [Paenibacillus algicola]|uniref:Cellobiose 2-epimerase n=1 Tax=Paenibacillus algicola TaxID=2565926 RepID=A0A4P8XGE9_9BACL|nr:AGE family epimerase/isomerase [Paenibacillus algicola]QCT01526.1 N-acylglucosamine 2-epimerase [Paenibacillus algicola]